MPSDGGFTDVVEEDDDGVREEATGGAWIGWTTLAGWISVAECCDEVDSLEGWDGVWLTSLMVLIACLYACMSARHAPEKDCNAESMMMTILWKKDVSFDAGWEDREDYSNP